MRDYLFSSVRSRRLAGTTHADKVPVSEPWMPPGIVARRGYNDGLAVPSV